MQVELLRELDVIPVAKASSLSSVSRTLLPFDWQTIRTCASTASSEDMASLLEGLSSSGQLLPGRALAFESRLAFVDLQCLW